MSSVSRDIHRAISNFGDGVLACKSPIYRSGSYCRMAGLPEICCGSTVHVWSCTVNCVFTCEIFSRNFNDGTSLKVYDIILECRQQQIKCRKGQGSCG